MTAKTIQELEPAFLRILIPTYLVGEVKTRRVAGHTRTQILPHHLLKETLGKSQNLSKLGLVTS